MENSEEIPELKTESCTLPPARPRQLRQRSEETKPPSLSPPQSSSSSSSPSNHKGEVDPLILTALKNATNRMVALRIEKSIVKFIKSTDQLELQLDQMNSFYRLLAHKIADYYNIGHTRNFDNSSVIIFKLNGAAPQLPDRSLYSLVEDAQSGSQSKQEELLKIKSRAGTPGSILLRKEGAADMDDKKVYSIAQSAGDGGKAISEMAEPEKLAKKLAQYQEARRKIFENDEKDEVDAALEEISCKDQDEGWVATLDPEYRRSPLPYDTASSGYPANQMPQNRTWNQNGSQFVHNQQVALPNQIQGQSYGTQFVPGLPYMAPAPPFYLNPHMFPAGFPPPPPPPPFFGSGVPTTGTGAPHNGYQKPRHDSQRFVGNAEE